MSQELKPSTALLVAMCGVQLIEGTGFSIVNVALPSISAGLDIGLTGQQWVISAYALTFSGFLLLGGRAADLVGRRRLLLFGFVLAATFSLVAALAPTAGVLIVARLLQGTGAALSLPAAFSVLSSVYEEGPARSRALGMFGAMGAVGFSLGLLLGGPLTDLVSWRAVFVVTATGLVLLAVAVRRILPADSLPPSLRDLDVWGALTVSIGLVLLVLGITNTESGGWLSVSTLAVLVTAAATLFGFVMVEARVSNPLVPLRIFRQPSLRTANLIALGFNGVFVATVFFVTVYLQTVLGFSATQTSLAFIPIGVGGFVFSNLGGILVARVGARVTATVGLSTMAAATLLLSRLTETGTYFNAVLVPLSILAAGLGLTYVSVTVASVSDVAPQDHGLAGGLINTSLQAGSGVVLAALAAIASAQTEPDATATGLVEGIRIGLYAGAGLCVAAALLAITSIPKFQSQLLQPDSTENDDTKKSFDSDV